MMGTETDISDTRETLANTLTLACTARQASTSTHSYLSLVKNSVLVVPTCCGIKVSLKCHIYEYLP